MIAPPALQAPGFAMCRLDPRAVALTMRAFSKHHALTCVPIDSRVPMKDPAHSAATGAPSHPWQRLARILPPHLWLLLALHAVASLAHFAHNAETIAFYPNMPAWLTPGDVYGVWLALSGLAVGGLLLLAIGRWRSGIALIAAYGASGLDGLGHYALALCAQHSLAANLTIGAEAFSGVLLMLASLRLLGRDLAWRPPSLPRAPWAP